MIDASFSLPVKIGLDDVYILLEDNTPRFSDFLVSELKQLFIERSLKTGQQHKKKSSSVYFLLEQVFASFSLHSNF